MAPALYLLLFARVVVGVAFIISALGKVRDFTGFERAIADFKLLPPALHRVTAVFVLSSELAVVILLTLGGSLLGIGLLLAVGILLAFTAVLASVLVRRIQTSCHCFGPSDKPVSRYDLWRNTGFIICTLAGWAALSTTNGKQVALSVIEIGVAGIAALLFFLVLLSLADIAQILRQL